MTLNHTIGLQLAKLIRQNFFRDPSQLLAECGEAQLTTRPTRS
jgi:hypothetical protein